MKRYIPIKLVYSFFFLGGGKMKRIGKVTLFVLRFVRENLSYYFETVGVFR